MHGRSIHLTQAFVYEHLLIGTHTFLYCGVGDIQVRDCAVAPAGPAGISPDRVLIFSIYLYISGRLLKLVR